MKSQGRGDLPLSYFFQSSTNCVVFWFLIFFCKNQLRRGGCPNSVGVGDLPLDAISTALDHARGLRSLGEGRVGRFGEQSAVAMLLAKLALGACGAFFASPALAK